MAPGVEVRSEAGASVSGKGVGVSKGIVPGFSAVTTGGCATVGERVADGSMRCGVEIWLAAGEHPDRMIKATGRRTGRRFMVCRLGAASEWEWVWVNGTTLVYA